MIIIKIIIGLFGLGIVIFLHELGHFAACKAVGIDVDAFSLGWGKPILRKKWRGTEYRISILPVGGYCKMKGEEIFKNAIEQNSDQFEEQHGSMFSASAIKRIFVYLAGPLANFITAVLIMSIVILAGYSIETLEPKIILVSDYTLDRSNAADIAGLETGDIITAVNGKEINYMDDLQRIIKVSPNKELVFTVNRTGQFLDIPVTPKLNEEESGGVVGFYFWIDPVIDEVMENTPAAEADLQAGDRIISVNGNEVSNSQDFFESMISAKNTVEITVLREGSRISTSLQIFYNTDGALDPGFNFLFLNVNIRERNPFRAAALGFQMCFDTLKLTIDVISSFFRGVNLKNTTAGVLRTTNDIGATTINAFKEGIGIGLSYFFYLISMISILLGFSNLLPIPALDGGMILFNIAQMISRKKINPRIFYRYNIIGFIIILSILILTLINDISFFGK